MAESNGGTGRNQRPSSVPSPSKSKCKPGSKEESRHRRPSNKKRPFPPRSAFQMYSDMNFRRVRARVIVKTEPEADKRKLNKAANKQALDLLINEWKELPESTREVFKNLSKSERETLLSPRRMIVSENGVEQLGERKEMRLLKLTLQYDGSNYKGFQTQANESGVQDAIEYGLAKLGEPQRIRSCSRTDAGVHAEGQVITVLSESDPLSLMHKLNVRLPQDICITRSELAPAQFDPRKDSLWKIYRYTIHNTSTRPIFGRHYCWHVRTPLDENRMQSEVSHLVGTHDFTSFCKIDRNSRIGEGKDNVRRIFSGTVTREQGDKVIIELKGNSFLYNMVRIIVGTLVEIEKGQKKSMSDILRAKKRCTAGGAAPAKGLCLIHVEYSSQSKPDLSSVGKPQTSRD